ncbi:xyloglucan O-acetyltransferase 2-like [Nymphaea colorata]|nr:xyloglucan O-acetyltransferase 2-like [Nymphaea colorata]
MGSASFSEENQTKKNKQIFGWEISRRDARVLRFGLCVFCATGVFALYFQNSLWPNFTMIGLKQQQTTRGGECDIFNGHWVWDPKGPMYTNWSCPTLPSSKNCQGSGRPDQYYLNWRWKPNACELPRFDGSTFLSLVQGKKLAFIGDSVARNQMESLLCLLSQVETPQDIYKDAEDRDRYWFFPSHNFTLIVLWSKFLVQVEEITRNGPYDIDHTNIYINKPDMNWARRIHDLDYIVLSNGHWFFRKSYFYKGQKCVGCLYCGGDGGVEDKNMVDLGLEYGLGRAFRTALKLIDECKECKDGLVTFLRTFSPSHFENGAWNGGGGCNKTMPLGEESVDLEGMDWRVRNTQIEELERVRKGGRKKRRIEVLDVTESMLVRADGHPDKHWGGYEYVNRSDCVHWCLPGPIDAWNEMLLEAMKRFLSHIWSPTAECVAGYHEQTKNRESLQHCDFSMGQWIHDPTPPLYDETTCKTISEGQNCVGHGRPDTGYLYWQWRPSNCTLPRFDPATFLSLTANQKLLFVGDSMARNQLESLLCLLSTLSQPVLTAFDHTRKFRTWVFPSHNLTISVLWSPFLVKGVEKDNDYNYNRLFLDVVDARWAEELKTADMVLFSMGHWFLHPAVYFEGDEAVGCHYCPGLNHTEIGFFGVLRKVLRTSLGAIVENGREMKVVVTTFSPAHFDGEWDKAGACDRKVPYKEGEKELQWMDKEMRKVEVEEVESFKRKGANFEVLDVTNLAMMRPDAHPGPYMHASPFNGGFKDRVQNDCVHWCLPGAIDTWNEILLQMMRRWRHEERRR